MKFYFTYGTRTASPLSAAGLKSRPQQQELQHLHFGRFTPTRPKDC